MNEQPHIGRQDKDDEVADLLSRLDQDIAPFRSDVFDRVNQLAAEVFAGGETNSRFEQSKDMADGHGAAPQQRPIQRSRSMITKTAAALAAIACTITLLINLPGPASGDVTLGSILDKTLDAESLQLRVSRQGIDTNVWVRPPGQIRWEESATSYQIASGSTLWRIDEQTNTVAATTNPWLENGRVDLLAMLGLTTKSSARFRTSTALKVVDHAGKKCRVFEMVTADRNDPWFIEALAEINSGQLLAILAWPNENRKGTPIAELRLITRNLPIDESKFVVAESLSEDGRIGKVVDSQGIVSLRPVMAQRWTPVARQILAKPGDWLRTDLRGANAARVALTSQFGLVVGPGSLVELQSPNQSRLHYGEIQVSGTAITEGDFALVGPGDQKLSIPAGGSVHYRIDREGNLQEVTSKPGWLAGFEGSSNNESIGSLVAKIDGRDVPLSVGYHKVGVEIRDQIARTTIEESFVNRTDQTLEGIFYFPLPQDASISGFGMWINGELIEADVVEKQRAREIYETILREKRDPGLLEWAGGNIFKARVFPILPHSEKRIRIVYTQVLPMKNNRYRYSYGLRSELLRKTPVRELTLQVQAHSAQPIKSVSCQTHPVRLQNTEHSAKLEFAAQEYTPQRDFEVVFEVDSRQSDVVVIPHRRGDDGYFMVQFSPPGGEGIWQREVIAEGKPITVLLVCDTSASMDSEKRELQHQFVAAFLSALSPEDRFNIAYCDVSCRWLHQTPVEPGEAETTAARDWLSERISLGWTNLDRMAESLTGRFGENSHLIYVGDGIVTAGDTDPHAFVTRWNRLTANKSGSFHAVSAGNSFDSVVLKAISAVGGGSLRQITGEQTAQQVALELLGEITRPGLKELKVEVRGLQVAALYPEKLPNLVAGAQQILLGRYLPQREDQQGQIVIEGTRNGKVERFAARVTLEDAESGNSFIPRLWARAHLDYLMEQGSSQAIQEEIISLSEQFHIITPYTSLLVLETDEDRERFGVKRRFQMRDGERFFAEGRDRSTFELLQQQMKRAGDWRLELRRRFLFELTRLGRDPQRFQPAVPGLGGGGALRGFASKPASGPSGLFLGQSVSRSSGGFFPSDSVGMDEEDYELGGEVFGEGREALDDGRGGDLVDLQSNERVWADDLSSNIVSQSDLSVAQEPMLRRAQLTLGSIVISSDGASSSRGGIQSYHGFGWYDRDNYTAWVEQLFPNIPGPSDQQGPPSKWPAEAVAISQGLKLPITIDAGGLEINRHVQARDPRWNRPTRSSKWVDLYSDKRRLSFSTSAGMQTVVNWCDDEVRGVYTRAYQLGRTRNSVAGDLRSFQAGERPFAVNTLHETFDRYDVEIQRPDGSHALLLLTSPAQPGVELRFLIDTARNVLIEQKRFANKALTSTTKYSGYLEVAGAFWPAKIETFDQKNRTTALVTQTVRFLDAASFGQRLRQELPDPETAKLIQMPLPDVRKSQVASANGSASFENQLVLMLQDSKTQRWSAALNHLDELDKLAPDKPGLAWIRAAVLVAARRNEQARQLLSRLAANQVASRGPDVLFLTRYLLERAQRIVDSNEMLRLLDSVRAVFDRHPDVPLGSRDWAFRRCQALRALERTSELIALQQQLAAGAPWDVRAQNTYARDLASAGEYDKAYRWLRGEIDRNEERRPHDLAQLRDHYASLLRDQGRGEDCVAFLSEWVETNPASTQAYEQYLSALILADRTDEADDVARKWIEEARIQTKLEPAPLARLRSAISYARGQRYQLYMNWLDPVWVEPLQETAVFFLGHEHHHDISREILDNHLFRNTDGYDRVIGEIARRLAASAESIEAAFLIDYVGWVIQRPNLTVQQWKTVSDTLRQRWDVSSEAAERQKLGDALARIYAARFADTEALPFMRQRIERGRREQEPAHAAGHTMALFNELLYREWNAEHEAEAVRLIPSISNADRVSDRLIGQIGALHRFTDRMLESRFQTDQRKLQDSDHPEQLTRTELAARQAQFRRAAREGVAASLANHANMLAQLENKPEGSDELLQWVRLERIYLDVKLARNLAQVTEECWSVLGEKPQPPTAADGLVDPRQRETSRRSELHTMLRNRAFATLHYLAVRRSAPQALLQRVRKFVENGIALGGDVAAEWKEIQFALLVELDEPDQLEKSLREWIRTDPFPAPWQRGLAKLLAERGKITDAIRLLEAVERDTQLHPDDYQALGDWYLVNNQRQQHRRAKVEVFKAMEEHAISNLLRRKLHPWERTDAPLPSELDEDVLFAFQALFEKSNQPGNYVSQLREFYTASRDFRLLQMIPDSLLGRTPQQVYPFLKLLRSNLMYEVRKEATADEILERLKQIRSDTTSAIDLRALDLLESIVERQCSEVLNQPKPHIDAAVAALKRAFNHDWADGEVRQMAELLDSLGTIRQPNLADERLRQLRELHRMTEPATPDGLFVCWNLAHALFHSHDHRDEGIATLEVGIREFERVHPDGWPAYANAPVEGFVGLLEAARRFAAAENFLTRQLARPLNNSQRLYLTQRRNQLYQQAFRDNGLVSLGASAQLYGNLEEHLRRQLPSNSDNHRRQVVSQLMQVYRQAKQKNITAYRKDLDKFAFEILPAVLVETTNNYTNLVGETSDTVDKLLGRRTALRFLIERLESYPKRFDFLWDNPWQQFGYQLATWLKELRREIGDLEPRLLAVVLKELRHDLLTRNSRSRYLYHYGYNRELFWKEKEADFARVAEEVLQQYSGSNRSVTYVAEYLYRGLRREDRAIEILSIAHQKGILTSSQQIVLCGFLHAEGRYGESIPILEPLIESSPNLMDYRVRLITAYGRSSRPQQMRELLSETDARFRDGGNWTESNISKLAACCLELNLFEEAVGYYGELIPLHQRTTANRGIGNHTLSAYYSQLARAHSGLGNTHQAVEAAAGGVVAWGPSQSQRSSALNWLKRVISDAKDLDDYVKFLDDQSAKTGQDSPLIRHQVGLTYADRGSHAEAVAQLKIAVALQPTNPKTHEALIESYEALQDHSGVVRQTLALLDFDRHNLELYRKLASRLNADEALAERAATTIVEAAPLEASHHRTLAELRQDQDRWPEAITHWEHVARLRALEPDGLLKLAEAQVHEQRWDDARRSIAELNRTEWPARFRNVQDQTRKIQKRIPETR